MLDVFAAFQLAGPTAAGQLARGMREGIGVSSDFPTAEWALWVIANQLLVRHEVADVTAGRQLPTPPPVLPGVSYRSVRRW
jgi:hypothetical protein